MTGGAFGGTSTGDSNFLENDPAAIKQLQEFNSKLDQKIAVSILQNVRTVCKLSAFNPNVNGNIDAYRSEIVNNNQLTTNDRSKALVALERAIMVLEDQDPQLAMELIGLNENFSTSFVQNRAYLNTHISDLDKAKHQMVKSKIGILCKF